MGRPAQKRRKLNVSATEEVVFDLAARQDYLTGFHKRKVQRTKAAQEAAARRAREEKIEARREHRAERKAEIEKHVNEVNALLSQARSEQKVSGDSDDDSHGDSDHENDAEEWSGLDDTVAERIDHEAEYIDEDKYTTVTVEEVDISRDGITKTYDNVEDEEDHDDNGKSEANDKATTSKTIPSATKPTKSDKRVKAGHVSGKKEADQKRKKKKRNFRYESPAERKLTRLKVKAKKTKQAKARKGGD